MSEILKLQKRLIALESAWDLAVELCHANDKVVRDLQKDLELAQAEAAALRVSLREAREGEALGPVSVVSGDEPLFEIATADLIIEEGVRYETTKVERHQRLWLRRLDTDGPWKTTRQDCSGFERMP